MKKIDEWYLKYTSEQVHTSARSLIEGTIQQLLAIFGNYGQYLGFRLRTFAFLLLFPLIAVVLSLGHFKKFPDRKALWFLTGAVITVVAFSAVLAIRAGHTTSFNARYGIYAIPFASALLGIAVHGLIFGTMPKEKKILIGFSLAITFFIFIFSEIPAYTGIASTFNSNPELHKAVLSLNLDKYYSKDQYEPTAKKIEAGYMQGDTIIYRDWNTAQVINLFFHDTNKNIVQKVTPGLEKNILFYENMTGRYHEISEK